MPSTTAEATREDLLAEYVIRDAVGMALNRIYHLLYDTDRDIAERLPGRWNEDLIEDNRRDELFCQLFPGDEKDSAAPHPMGVEAGRSSMEAEYLAARILRAIVHRADYLRGESDYLYSLSRTTERRIREAQGGDDV